MRRLLWLSILLFAGCSSPSSPTGAASGLPSASSPKAAATTATGSPHELLFVVLEARGPKSSMGAQPGSDAHDRVAIVGLDGFARAKADFTPRQIPTVGPAAPLLQPEARIAGGRVFYVDGAGVVRELTRAGSRTVATFPLKAQQEISFGVSPDGTHLEATRNTFPPLNPNSTDMSNMFLSDRYQYELLAADAGGGTRTLVTSTGSYDVNRQPDVIGWDAKGPIATIDTAFGTQQDTMGRTVWGHAVHLDSSGRPGPALGGSDCGLVSMTPNALLCVNDTALKYTVRSADGRMLWSLPPKAEGQYYSYVVLSPDASRIAFTGGIRAQDGSALTLPANFNPEGWLDNQTVIGITGQGTQQELGIVRLSSPSHVDDLGFKGEFIGVVQTL